MNITEASSSNVKIRDDGKIERIIRKNSTD